MNSLNIYIGNLDRFDKMYPYLSSSIYQYYFTFIHKTDIKYNMAIHMVYPTE